MGLLQYLKMGLGPGVGSGACRTKESQEKRQGEGDESSDFGDGRRHTLITTFPGLTLLPPAVLTLPEAGTSPCTKFYPP